jgi:glucosamine-6-phosphate deaminase
MLQPSYEELSRAAARIVAEAVRKKPSLTLGLATGNTMVGTYRELVRMHKQEGLDFSRVATFNLDEYVGIPPSHPQSFHYFMRRNFFDHVNVDPENIHIPSIWLDRNYEEYCAFFEASLRSAGGIDMQILGIGRDGHIGFNEPMSSLGSRTRVKTLKKETIEDNRGSFNVDEEMPQCALTMGIATILEARKIVVLAAGNRKARAVAQTVEGPVTASVPASALQFHPDTTLFVEEEAASELVQKDYYRQVAALTARVSSYGFR